jgi:hypothetical protein
MSVPGHGENDGRPDDMEEIRIPLQPAFNRVVREPFAIDEILGIDIRNGFVVYEKVQVVGCVDEKESNRSKDQPGRKGVAVDVCSASVSG